MKKIAAIDVGGTAVKYGLWDPDQQKLLQTFKTATPGDLTTFYDLMNQIVSRHEIRELR
ncbi:hypothetical protein [Xylocopilactobacillus apicola]|uniref:Uncharacterized protein n=1 Tax=Xylocopilactobacillus apicola TaxID=2932184 RepID=A0AAU9CYS8_9LACO|nr:hypothetical protein [Xylocopilactobacillus apicola]BDR57576.1 hypothetical protein XA3_00170 [Xylocopilactobacillus apicola]